MMLNLTLISGFTYSGACFGPVQHVELNDPVENRGA